jgi:UDP-N-acetylmuramate dehydrogenase
VSEAIHRAEEILRAACGERLRTAFPLGPLTTFQIGGPAALYLEPVAEEDLVAAGDALAEAGIPVLVIGRGSNLLVSDRGFAGLVLRLGAGFRWASRDGDRVSAGAGMPLPALAGLALSHGLAGLEWGVAIPASFGGAVRMNAGAHGSELGDVLETIEVFELGRRGSVSVAARTAGLHYRGSSLPEDGVVTAARVRLREGNRTQIRARMDEIREWRRANQPLAEPNCGSVFKNPPGDHAARLIEEAGLKGMTVGRASVSTKHANFIVASEGARAADVVDLIRSVQEIVAARHDVRLEPEVHLVGDFDRVPH